MYLATPWNKEGHLGKDTRRYRVFPAYGPYPFPEPIYRILIYDVTTGMMHIVGNIKHCAYKKHT